MTSRQYNPALRFGIHFAPLFMVAATAWVALQLAVSGGAHIVPGLIVAALLAAGGTRFALGDDTRETHGELRTARPAPFTSSSPIGTVGTAAGD